MDISRVTFDPRKHYTGVRMQQGRVTVDDDWNENERIEDEDRRRARVHIIGPHGSPDNGFRISKPHPTSGGMDFDIESGCYYLGGLRLDNESGTTFRLQPDWLQKPVIPYSLSHRIDLVYLEGWRQPVTAVEDSELYEVALGGPDTTCRLREMWRVNVFPDVDTEDCAEAWQKLNGSFVTAGLGSVNKEQERVGNAKLTVGFAEGGPPEDLCTPAVAGGYLGAENQAIRVQIIDARHFTWGYDNASPLYRVHVNEAGTIVTLLTQPVDQHHWPRTDQVVEILAWSSQLANGEKVAELTGHLSRVSISYNPDSGVLTLATPLPAGFGKAWTDRDDADELAKNDIYLFMRVWDRGLGDHSDPAVEYTPGTPVPLGDTGLTVTISGNARVPGDFWVIAARPVTHKPVVPWVLEDGQALVGVRRFFAPLCLIRWQFLAIGTVVGEVLHDCRETFRPLTRLETCCTYSVGDGVHSYGDFDSIQEAVDNLPAAGGKICVLPGVHSARVKIVHRENITISGCGKRTIVQPPAFAPLEPIFQVEETRGLTLEGLALTTLRGTAVSVVDPKNSNRPSREITVRNCYILAGIRALEIEVDNAVSGSNDVRIIGNRIALLNIPQGDVAIFSRADDVLIAENKIVIVPAPDKNDTNDPRDPDDESGGGFDPCTDPDFFYSKDFNTVIFVHQTFLYHGAILVARSQKYKARGGIQIGSGSERVTIRGNQIIGGRGTGIVLADIPVREGLELDDSPFVAGIDAETIDILRSEFDGFLYGLVIEENHIHNMGLAGIGVVAFFHIGSIGLMATVEELTITGNTIIECCRQLPDAIPDEMLEEAALGGIVLADVDHAVLRHNRISDNGPNHRVPVCGIFILHGDQIEIDGNRITGNGPIDPDVDGAIQPGPRSGIFVSMSVSERFAAILDAIQTGTSNYTEGVPALEVHNNVVVQPLGQALTAMAMGPVAVTDNRFTSQGADFTANPRAFFAAAVSLFNLGMAKNFLGQLLSPQLFAETPLDFTDLAQVDNDGINYEPLLESIPYGGFFPTGKVLFNSNQVTLDLTSPEQSYSLGATLIASLDDIGFTGNQMDCHFLADLLFTNTALYAPTVRCTSNRFEEGLVFALNSLYANALVLTVQDNQASHCLVTRAAPNMLVRGDNLVLFAQYCEQLSNVLGGRQIIKMQG